MLVAAAVCLLVDVATAASPMPASTCPGLFGRAVDHRANRVHRTRVLYWLQHEGRSVTLAHASDRWQRPSPITFVGVKVVAAAAHQQAEVVLSSRLASSVGCRPGSYALGRDASIAGAAVLGVLAQGLLIERHGTLHFVGRAGAQRPSWLMIWGSPYQIAVSQAPAQARPPSSRRRHRHRRYTLTL